MARIPFVKLQGTGNDFLLIDRRRSSDNRPLAAEKQNSSHDDDDVDVDHSDDARLCEWVRHVCSSTSSCDGGGADGVLLLLPPTTAADTRGGGELDAILLAQFTARLRIINRDGSEAEMCGNGVRCVGRYLLSCCDEASVEEARQLEWWLSTLAGPIRVRAEPRGGGGGEEETLFSVGMRAPHIAERYGDCEAGVLPHREWFVDVGNPHVVRWLPNVADVDVVDVRAEGQAVEQRAEHRATGGVNVHFVAASSMPVLRLHVRHWERGAGETQACGTGCVACAAVAVAHFGFTSPVTIQVPGGMLRVTLLPHEAILAGAAVEECRGELPAM